MQIRSLTLSAVGPFASECRIDFDRLGASGLFLLEGPTGAGKSTIVDALTFALYGTLAGQATSAASAAKIRSDYAAAGTDTFVELDFETAAGVFRVRRSPEYERPKARGEGTTKERAHASLWRLTPDLQVAEHLSGRAQEVGAEVLRIVGLSREQFAQTVVLPQGEFATFLRATPDERQAVLERVFGTGLYERVRKLLEEDRQAAKNQLKASENRLSQAIAAGSGAIGLDQETAKQLATTAEQSLAGAAADLEKAVAELSTQVEKAANVRAASEQAAGQANAALQRGQQIHTRWLRQAELTGRHRQLMDGTDEQRERGCRLDAALRAEAIVAAADEFARADRAYRRGRGEAGEQWTQIGALAQQVGWAEPIAQIDTLASNDSNRFADGDGVRLPGGSALRQVRDLLAARCAELGRAAELEGEIAGRREGLTELRSQLADKNGQLAAARRAAQQLPALIDAISAEHRQIVAVAAGRGERKLRHQVAADRLRAAERADDLAARVEEQTARVAEATTRAAAAIDAEHLLRRHRIEGMAAELASGLLEGQPCPVCGATAHPNPATTDRELVDDDAVAQAESVRRGADRELASQHGDLVRIQTELRACSEAAAGTVEQACQALDIAAAELSEATTAENDAAELATQIDRLRQDLTDAHERVTQLAADVADLDRRCVAEESDLADRQQLIDAAADGWPTVRARLEQATVLLGHLDRVQAMLSDLAAAGRTLDERRKELNSRLDGVFDTLEQARSAALSASDRDHLAEQIEAHRAELRAIELALADPELADLPPDDADLDHLAQLADQTSAQARAANAEHAELHTRHQRAEAACTRVNQALADHERLGARLAPIIRMANLATGSSADARKVTLPSYVLLRRFDEVIAAANDRLQTLSDGRYSLVRYGERERGSGTRTGLGLRVADHQTGRERPAATLSGGESFYASLSLALGLADVVRSEAGGIELGTLFIDEGFGSLDPEVLDRVLAVLSSLRSGGRMVGVISHVDTLKLAIPDRLEVRRNPDGSSRVRLNA